LDLTKRLFPCYITLHSKQPLNKGYNMLNQAFIAIIANRYNLDTKEVLELSNWIRENVERINELFDPSDFIETFESFQRQESNEALATEFINGRATGFTEVRYNAETGEELPVDDTYGMSDFLADCAF